MVEEITIKEATEGFYKKDFSFSYSSFSKLLWSPVAFHQIYIMGIREEMSSPALTNGKVIHALLLNNDIFDDMFVVSPINLPTQSTKNIIDRVWKHREELVKNGDERTELNEYKDAIIDVLVDVNLHQSLKTDLQRIDKIITEETENYWKFLKTKDGKQVIDVDTYKYCLGAVQMVKNSPEIVTLMGLNVSEFDNIEVFNELYLEKKMEKYKFGLKGILDNLVINHDEKIIYINDLKTTNKDLKDFQDTIEYYNYWIQAIMYITLVYFKYNDLIINNGYNVKFNFVVLDRNFMIYAFPLTMKTQQEWLTRFSEEVLIPANHHYTNKIYELPYKFCTKQISL